MDHSGFTRRRSDFAGIAFLLFLIAFSLASSLFVESARCSAELKHRVRKESKLPEDRPVFLPEAARRFIFALDENPSFDTENTAPVDGVFGSPKCFRDLPLIAERTTNESSPTPSSRLPGVGFRGRAPPTAPFFRDRRNALRIRSA